MNSMTKYFLASGLSLCCENILANSYDFDNTVSEQDAQYANAELTAEDWPPATSLNNPAPAPGPVLYHFYIGADFIYYQHDLPLETAATYFNFIPWIPTLGQLSLGFQFTPYFAIEANYLGFQDDSHAGATTTIDGLTEITPDALKINGIDLLVKGIMPFNQYISSYAAAGAAYVHQKNYNVIWGYPQPVTFIDSDDYRVLPAIGAGFNFRPMATNQWLSIDVGVKYYFANGPISSFIIVPIGISLHFG